MNHGCLHLRVESRGMRSRKGPNPFDPRSRSFRAPAGILWPNGIPIDPAVSLGLAYESRTARMMLFPGRHTRRRLNPHAGHAPGLRDLRLSSCRQPCVEHCSSALRLVPCDHSKIDGDVAYAGISTALKGRRKKEASKPGQVQVEEIFRAHRSSRKGPAPPRTYAANSPE